MKTKSEYRRYRKKGVIDARPYEPEDNLNGVSVSPNDRPQDGGWIACDPDNPTDRWFINSDYFHKHYEEVS